MKTDILLLVLYALSIVIAKPSRRISVIAVFVWFLLSFTVAEMDLFATTTFLTYWVFAGALTAFLACRGSAIVVYSTGAMFLLQFAMVVDSLVTNQETPLYNSYGTISLILNLVILLATYIHGKGLESVDSDTHCPFNHNNKQRH